MTYDYDTNGSLPSTKLQAVAFKAINEKEVLPSKVVQLEVVGLNDKEMGLVIKRFKTALKGHKVTTTRRTSQRGNMSASSAISLVNL
jgi:hypothetical protein